MNHLHSGLTDLVNILKQESKVSVIVLKCMQVKHIIMHLTGDWKLTKCCVDVFFNFGKMYKFPILVLLSHPILWMSPHCSAGTGGDEKFSWREIDLRLPVSGMFWLARAFQLISYHDRQMETCLICLPSPYNYSVCYHLLFASFSVSNAEIGFETHSNIKTSNNRRTCLILRGTSIIIADLVALSVQGIPI